MSKFKVGQRVVCYDMCGRSTGRIFLINGDKDVVKVTHGFTGVCAQDYHIKQCRRLFKPLKIGDRAYFINEFGEKHKGTILDRFKSGGYILQKDGTEHFGSFFKRSELTRLVKKKKEIKVGDRVGWKVIFDGKERKFTGIVEYAKFRNYRIKIDCDFGQHIAFMDNFELTKLKKKQPDFRVGDVVIPDLGLLEHEIISISNSENTALLSGHAHLPQFHWPLESLKLVRRKEGKSNLTERDKEILEILESLERVGPAPKPVEFEVGDEVLWHGYRYIVSEVQPCGSSIILGVNGLGEFRVATSELELVKKKNENDKCHPECNGYKSDVLEVHHKLCPRLRKRN